MRPRPPGQVSSMSRSVSTAVITLLLLLPVLAASQQSQPRGPVLRSPHEGLLNDPLVASASYSERRKQHEFEPTHNRFKDTVISNDASAVATLAPATIENAVRAPTPVRSTGKSAGLSSLLNARSLRDWEVEDIVLLATVDGTIHARDRKTGAPRWALEADKPMVETIYHRHNRSQSDQYRPEEDFLWIVEPSRDGSLYIYSPSPNGGLQKLGLTVKRLVEELSPYAGEDPPVVYTAEKRNTLYTVDAGSGRVLKVFSSGGSTITDDTSCRRVSGLEGLDEEECGSSGTLTLGRTEYTVGIQSRDTGEPICTLKYFEWGPNNRDNDLNSQYLDTMDKKYVYSRHDGSIFGFDHTKLDDRRKLYTQKFSSPVARVFDVVRPMDSEPQDISLVILPQPIGPTDEEFSTGFTDRDERIFVNCTENGGWYALSENTYPLVTGGAALAQCSNPDWRSSFSPWNVVDITEQKKILVGVHSINQHDLREVTVPTISGPSEHRENDIPFKSPHEQPLLPTVPAIRNSRLLGFAKENAVDIGITIPFLVLMLIIYVNRRILGKMFHKTLTIENMLGLPGDLASSAPPTPSVPQSSAFNDFADAKADSKLSQVVSNTNAENISEPAISQKKVEFADLRDDRVLFEDTIGDDQDGLASPPKKKKTHRGQRGGAGRRKGKKDLSKDADKETIDKIVDEVKEINKEQPIEPDVKTISGPTNGVTDVSTPFQINNLVVTDTVLGYGSHGTIVYRGSFEGREVAVKRMLLEFFDVASHEVGLLQESDDHPNVIRYFCRQQSAGFLYIALELCPASLQDVVEKPHEHQDLARAAGLDLPNVLYQIAAGVKYLHSLKIVHRDLKPQNILVANGKVSRTNPDIILPPRLLISDFGLCKKLDADQSSFRATTAQAAGTSGWRAPELLIDDDASPPQPVASESTQNTDTSEPAVIDTLSNRRATRAIDIFSLGCVFYYVLTQGSHPFGDRYMREANIVKGQYNLDQLQGLGDYAFEAIDLVQRMIDHNPRRRPDATTVMTHPFFWSAEKRLTFLCDVSDHFEWEPRDPPSQALEVLESVAPNVLGMDFLKKLDRSFIDTLGKQRKYTGSKILDLLRALRNKKNHYQDMPDSVKAMVGSLPEGYLRYWTLRFPRLLLECWGVVIRCGLEDEARFKAYFAPPL